MSIKSPGVTGSDPVTGCADGIAVTCPSDMNQCSELGCVEPAGCTELPVDDGTPCDIYVNETYSTGHSNGLVTGVVLAIANSNGDEALDTGEKGFLLVALASDAVASARTQINIEIRLETSATLSIEVSVPASMPPNTYVPVS